MFKNVLWLTLLWLSALVQVQAQTQAHTHTQAQSQDDAAALESGTACMAYWQIRAEGLSREGGIANKLRADAYLKQYQDQRDQWLQKAEASTLAPALYEQVAKQLIKIDSDYANSERLDATYLDDCPVPMFFK